MIYWERSAAPLTKISKNILRDSTCAIPGKGNVSTVHIHLCSIPPSSPLHEAPAPFYPLETFKLSWFACRSHPATSPPCRSRARSNRMFAVIYISKQFLKQPRFVHAQTATSGAQQFFETYGYKHRYGGGSGFWVYLRPKRNNFLLTVVLYTIGQLRFDDTPLGVIHRL